MTSPTWNQIAEAVQQAIATASGLSTIWSYQNVDAPALDYVRLSLGSLLTVGIDFVWEYDRGTGAPVTQEIAQALVGMREVPLQIEAFSSSAVETTAKTTALSIVDDIVGKLRLPRARDAFAAVGIVPFDPGPVNYVPDVVAIGFRGRAVCDVRCRMAARVIEEYTTYINSVAGTATISGMSGGPVAVPFSASR